jgi:hypothetical protein
MPANRRILWLAGALVAAIAVAVWSWSTGSAPSAASRPQERARGDPPPSIDEAGSLDVNLEALQAAREGPQAGRRNPFRFGAREGTGPATPVLAPIAPPSNGPEVPSGPPPPPPIALKFIGRVEKGDGTRVAILSGAGYTLFGSEGESIDGRYRILKIGVESLEIAYLDGRGRQTLRLSGQ